MSKLIYLLTGIAILGLTAGPAMADGTSKIVVDPIGHWHLFAAKKLKFTIEDEHEKGIAGH